ncbi:7-deoxyloganetic acid glucosyltransferase-like [Cornus florida]|uniref:7-deoxyloganetic acid glucosyltransferase-like n=1 Tax=Cornus florida TaxID=4283 RepID=UPI0028A13430|nr:7-deoxyloganetic acid glucosyltransferase-like [Cornus florida]
MEEKTIQPHVIIIPLPLQGPVNCMLKLAELLSLAGINVTFLNTDHVHRRLLRHTHIHSRFARFPSFRFQTVSDGLPEDHPRTADRFLDMFDAFVAVTKPLLRDMLTSGGPSSDTERPVTCVIADGIFDFVLDTAKENGIPVIYFDTLSPCCIWIYLCLPKLIEAGEFPFKGNNLDTPIKSVPGMEGFLRRRDLPAFCRSGDISDTQIQISLSETRQLPKAHGIILNTFQDLEEPTLSHIRSLCPNLYSIGPIHNLHKTNLAEETSSSPPASSNSFWEEDRDCMTWLDAQPLRSVVYVSFGSLLVTTRDDLMEFWHGLVNSGKKFLWVIRTNAVAGEDGDRQIPAELSEGKKESGYITRWAPQEEVLAHPAVGGFLTHSGWNSTLESIVAGVPMICWPAGVDQQVNSRFVSEVWKVGLDMKDTCDRVVIENMVNNLMEVRRDELVSSADEMAKLAKKSVSEGGSSLRDFNRLIQDIKFMNVLIAEAFAIFSLLDRYFGFDFFFDQVAVFWLYYYYFGSIAASITLCCITDTLGLTASVIALQIIGSRSIHWKNGIGIQKMDPSTVYVYGSTMLSEYEEEVVFPFVILGTHFLLHLSQPISASFIFEALLF